VSGGECRRNGTEGRLERAKVSRVRSVIGPQNAIEEVGSMIGDPRPGISHAPGEIGVYELGIRIRADEAEELFAVPADFLAELYRNSRQRTVEKPIAIDPKPDPELAQAVEELRGSHTFPRSKNFGVGSVRTVMPPPSLRPPAAVFQRQQRQEMSLLTRLSLLTLFSRYRGKSPPRCGSAGETHVAAETRLGCRARGGWVRCV